MGISSAMERAALLVCGALLVLAAFSTVEGAPAYDLNVGELGEEGPTEKAFIKKVDKSFIKPAVRPTKVSYGSGSYSSGKTAPKLPCPDEKGWEEHCKHLTDKCKAHPIARLHCRGT